jgi:hypothetical protein
MSSQTMLVYLRPISMRVHRVSWVLNILTWHSINGEKDDESFMGIEKVSCDETLIHCF